VALNYEDRSLKQLDVIKKCWHETLVKPWKENKPFIKYKELKQQAFKVLLGVMSNNFPEDKIPKKL